MPLQSLPTLEALGWPQGPMMSPGMGQLGTLHGAALGWQDWCLHGTTPGSGWDLGCGIPAPQRDVLRAGQELLPASSAPGDGAWGCSHLLRNYPSDCHLHNFSPSTQENQGLSSQAPCWQSSPWSTLSPHIPSWGHAAQLRSFHGRLSPRPPWCRDPHAMASPAPKLHPQERGSPAPPQPHLGRRDHVLWPTMADTRMLLQRCRGWREPGKSDYCQYLSQRGLEELGNCKCLIKGC